MLATRVAHAMGVASALKPERPRAPIAERPSGNDWNVPGLGMSAARAVSDAGVYELVEGSAMWICYMTAKDNASFAVALLAILVLHAGTKASARTISWRREQARGPTPSCRATASCASWCASP